MNPKLLSGGWKPKAVAVVLPLMTLSLVAVPAAAAVGGPSAKVVVTPAQLPTTGGKSVVTATVKNAATCQLTMLSVPAFPVVYSHNARDCSNGKFQARIVVFAGASSKRRVITFRLLVKQGLKKAYSPFSIVLLAKPVVKKTVPTTTTTTTTTPPSTTTSSTTTTTAPVGGGLGGGGGGFSGGGGTTPTTSGFSVSDQTSINWSGYAENGGPYTEISGSFTVPSLTTSATCTEAASEWVGLGANTSADTSLIQAGVTETEADPADPTACSNSSLPTAPYVTAWYEVLPGYQTPIALNVSAGQTISVAISKGGTSCTTSDNLTGTFWQIVVTDASDSSQQPSISTECYAGAGLSAEWIVEAPSSPTICNGTCDLAPYSPPVSFSSPSYTPDAYTQLDNITMTQNNTSVSQPSAVSSWPSDFTVQSV